MGSHLLSKRAITTTQAVIIIVIIVAAVGVGAYYATLPGPTTTTTPTTTTPTTTTTTTTTLPTTTTTLPGAGKKIGVVYDTGGKGDKSFNDLAYAGALKAQQDLGISFTELGSTSASDYRPNLEQFASQRVDLIIAVGFLMDTDVNASARAHPDIKYAQVDGDVFNLPNVVAIKFKENDGSALVGALAVAMSKTGKIGFIGGMDVPIIWKFAAGYIVGAQWAATELGKQVTILPPQYTGTTPAAWNAPDVAKSIANSMFGQGADIIFAAAGGSGLGLFDATKAQNEAQGWNFDPAKSPSFFAIGVDADQDYLGTKDPANPTPPGYILTSMQKRVDVGVYDLIKSVVYGNYSNFYNQPEKFSPDYPGLKGIYSLGIPQAGVGPSDLKYTSTYVTAEAKNIVNKLKQAIVSGQVTIPSDCTPLYGNAHCP